MNAPAASTFLNGLIVTAFGLALTAHAAEPPPPAPEPYSCFVRPDTVILLAGPTGFYLGRPDYWLACRDTQLSFAWREV